MTPHEVLLLLLALPGLYLGLVTLCCGALSLYACAMARNDPMDEVQRAAFEGRRGGLVYRGWWVAVEGFWTSVAFSLQALHMLPRPRRRLAPAPGATPVLLLGGYLENSGQMWMLGRRLRARGHVTVPLDLPSTLRAIDLNVAWLREQAREVLRETGASRVVIVGHSMGGVIGRALVHAPDCPPVACVVSIASPHRGTRMGSFGLGQSARDLCLGSAHMERHPVGRRGAAPVHCVVGWQENIVSPAWSAVLVDEGETLVLDEPTGHVAPLFMPAVAERVAGWIEGAATRHHSLPPSGLDPAASPQASPIEGAATRHHSLPPSGLDPAASPQASPIEGAATANPASAPVQRAA